MNKENNRYKRYIESKERKTKYIISLSPSDYVELRGICLSNVRDNLADYGLEESKRIVDRAIDIIQNNIEVLETNKKL